MNAHVDESQAHAVYAPSMGHVWAPEDGCTAAPTAIASMRRVVTEEEREEAIAGTKAHDEIERCFGLIEGVEDWRTVVDPDHDAAYGIALVMNYVQQLQTLHPGKLWIEQRVILTKDIWGRCDVSHWHEETATLTIVDFKNGFVGVDPDTEQLRIYAAAAVYTHNLPVKHVRYCVIQPNDFRPGPRCKHWHESAESLYAFASRVATIPNGPLTFRFGEHCRDCHLFGTCEPTKDILKQFATVVGTGSDPTPEQIPLFLACKKPIDHFFESLTKNGTKKALKGDMPPGMGLFTSVKHRVWLSEQAARDAVVAQKGVNALKPPTPAQAEEMGINVDGLTDKPEGGPVLGFVGDKRKPWTGGKSAAEMFKNVPGVVK